MEEFLTKDMRVLEFGAGQSTIWMAQRVAEVVTVEEDPDWARRILDRGQTNVVLHYPSCPEKFDHLFDFVLVDGGSDRVDNFLTGLTYLSIPDGVIMLDNSERDEYAECWNWVDGLKEHHAYGPDYTETWTYTNWRTTWWTR